MSLPVPRASAGPRKSGVSQHSRSTRQSQSSGTEDDGQAAAAEYAPPNSSSHKGASPGKKKLPVYEEEKVHPAVQRVIDFEAFMKKEDAAYKKQQKAARWASERLQARLGHHLTIPERLFQTGGLCMAAETTLIGSEMDLRFFPEPREKESPRNSLSLGASHPTGSTSIITQTAGASTEKSQLELQEESLKEYADCNPVSDFYNNFKEKQTEGLVLVDQAELNPTDPRMLAERDKFFENFKVLSINVCMLGAAERLQLEHKWRCYMDLMGQSHRRDGMLYELLYGEILKELFRDIFDDPDPDNGKFDPGRKFMFLACSPKASDHITPQPIKDILTSDGWEEISDFSLKRKYAHLYEYELHIDGEDPEKRKVLFRLSTFMLIDVCIPSHYNKLPHLPPDSYYKAKAMEILQKEIEENGKIDLSEPPPLTKIQQEEFDKRKAEVEVLFAIFEEKYWSPDVPNDTIDPDVRIPERLQEIMLTTEPVDMLIQDQHVMESGLLGQSHGDMQQYLLWNLCRNLRVALLGLEIDGSLILTWASNPFHMAFLYLRHRLEPFFDKVSMLTAPFPSMETILVCNGYCADMEEIQDFIYFLSRPQRDKAIDDILMWAPDPPTILGGLGGEGDDIWQVAKDLRVKVFKFEGIVNEYEEEKIKYFVELERERLRELERQRKLNMHKF